VRQTDTLIPPFVNQLDLRFPPGTQVRSGRLARCDLAELQAKGGKACPADARVGSGSITGRTVLHPRGISSKVSIFNGERIRSRRTVLMFVDPKLGSSLVLVGKLYGGRKGGVRIELLVPSIKILIGIPQEAALSDFALRFDRRDFLRAPCRARYRVTSHFGTGAVLTSSDRAVCR